MRALQKKNILPVKIIAAVCAVLILLLFGTGQSKSFDPDRFGTEQGDKIENNEYAQRDSVYLYFTNMDNSFLYSEQRTFSGHSSTLSLGKKIIKALIEGSKKGLVRTMPPGTTLKTFFLTEKGVAVVDLSSDIKDRHPGGVQAEMITIYSIVNTLILNIPDINAVKILIGGRESDTLAGHIDIRYPFTADMLLIR